MTLRFSHAAENDAADAVAWYNDQRGQLGYEFLDALHHLLETIEVAPQRFPAVDETNLSRKLRHALMRRFPYRVIYEIQSEESLLVLAVAHVRRHPNFWRNRSKD